MAIKKITNSRSKYYSQYRVRVEPVVNGKKVSVPVHYAPNKRQAELLQSRLMCMKLLKAWTTGMQT